MKQKNFRTAAVALALISAALGSPALGKTSGYDLSILLDQPYPLAEQPPPRDVGLTPVAPSQIYAPARVPPQSMPPRPAERAAAEFRPTGGVLAAGDGSIGRRRWLGGILSEVRVGALAHDEGPFSRHEESGIDGNLELLFVSPDLLAPIWSPRPHFGLTGNSDGNTHEAYLGLTWEWSFWRGLFAGFSLGGAIHSGHLATADTDRKELGCRVLFRESISLGYRFNDRHSISIFQDHISNARLCDHNEGLENVGLRYGYRF